MYQRDHSHKLAEMMEVGAVDICFVLVRLKIFVCEVCETVFEMKLVDISQPSSSF